MFRLKYIFAGILCVLMSVGPVWAEESAAVQIARLQETVAALALRVERQEAEIIRLQQAAPAMAAQTPTTSFGFPKVGQSQGRWNPDIGVVADVVWQADSPKQDEEGADRIAVRELELTFGSAVDPYTRMDATLGISDFEEMEVEEAYVTRFDLPWDITARFGRFLPRIGKSIPLHRDSLDTVDEPLVVEKYFGHHGFNKTGLDLTKPVDLPWDISHELTWGVLEGGNGEEGTLFGETRRHPTLYAHLKNYADLNETTGLEFGASHLVGTRDEDSSFEVQVFGLDGTLIHRYGDRKHLKLQGEAFMADRGESYYVREDDTTGETFLEDLDDARHLWGGYVLADWRFDPAWAAGFRYDNVQLIETDEDFANLRQTERGPSVYLTFYQSEFSRWRIQFSHLDLTDGQDDSRVFVQGTFAIGEHKHKLS